MSKQFSRTFNSHRRVDKFLRKMGMSYRGTSPDDPNKEYWADAHPGSDDVTVQANVFRKRANHILVEGDDYRVDPTKVSV